MPLNVQDLINELDPDERRKVDELTAKLRAEHDEYHRQASASTPPASTSSPPLAASPSKRQ